MATLNAEQVAKLKTITASVYRDQAVWYLNAFWNSTPSASEEAEEVYQLITAFEKEDFQNGKKGCELNAVQAFNLLQKRNQTKTALELKKMLREVDLDSNGEMALSEYLIHAYNRSAVEFVTNPQGSIDPEVLKALEAKLAELNATFEALQVQLAAEEKAEAEAKEQEAVAKADEEKARAAQAAAQAAEDELRAVEEEANAIAEEIRKQEQAKKDEMARLDALSQDQSVGIVKRNMAVQQLAALKNEDSLPLQKAKLTQEAVVRKLKKATDAAAEKTAVAKVASDAATESRNAATAAANQAAAKRAEAVAARELAEAKRAEAVASREAAEAKRAEAVAAKQAAEESKKATEAAVAKCQADLEEVTKEFEVIKSQTGIPLGFEWWTARTLEDKKRSLPQRMW